MVGARGWRLVGARGWKVCVWCVRGRGCLAGCRKLGSVAVAVVVLGEGGGARHAKRRILR